MIVPFTRRYPNQLSRYTVLLLLLLWAVPAWAGSPAGNGPGTTTPSLSQALNPDGTLQAGVNGSFDARAFTMATAPDGRPVFRPASANRVQGAGDEYWQDGFSLSGINGQVNALVVSGTDVYVGGFFTAVGASAIPNIVKWNGSSWSALGAGLNGGVRAMVLSGTDLYVGGAFTTAGGSPANRIAKWSGTAWSTLGTGMSDEVNALAMVGSTLYAGGAFTTAGGTTVNRIAQWNGTSWGVIGTGMNGTVHALAAANGTLYAGGDFTTAGGTTVNRIARWNGTAWSGFGTGANQTVRALAATGSTVYAGGNFNTINGVAANRIAYWNGSAWTALGVGVGASANEAVFSLTLVGTTLYVGGGFTTAGGLTVNRIAKWSGSAWSALGTGFDNGWVYALAVAGTDVYAGGSNTSLGFYGPLGGTTRYLARWNGSTWSTLGTGGANGTICALTVAGTDVYVGGAFTTIGGVAANYVAKWNGSVWSALGTGTNQQVMSLAVLGTDLYAGGWFTAAGGVSAQHIAKWNGTAWSALGQGMNSDVLALAVSGSTLYAGGRFTSAGGISAEGVARWNGTSWSALGAGVNGWVHALAVNGSTVYAGGEFTSAGGVSANYVARWSGTAWSALGAGTDYHVFALALSGSTLYAGGWFSTAGSTSVSYLAKWNGTTWSDVGGGVGGRLRALTVVGTDLYAGGEFFTAGGATARGVAKWNGTAWSQLGTGLNSTVLALGQGAGGKIYTGGLFTTVGDGSKVSAYFGVYDETPSPTLLSFTPGSGVAGTTSVTLTGTNFTGTTAVTFNGTTAPGFVVNSSSQITVTVPAGATSGLISVTTPNGTATSSSSFVVTAAPIVTGVSVPATQNYKLGQTLTFTVVFDAPVTVSGNPTLGLVMGASTVPATLVSGSGTTTLQFSRTVASTDLDLDGIALTAATALNGGSIVSSGGVAANRTLNGIPSTSGIKVDGVQPFVAASTRLLPAAASATGPDVTFRVVFNEAVSGVAASSFAAVSTGGVGGTVSGVVPVVASGGTTYDVTLTGINGDGAVRLAAPGTGPLVQDAFTNAYLATASVTGETYTIVPGNLLVSTPQNVSGMYANVTVAASGVATLTSNLTVTNELTVRSGGSLLLRQAGTPFNRAAASDPCNAISGAGRFVLEPGATLGICDPAGISLSGATGAVQVTGTRSFSDQAHYLYTGDAAQATGDGLPATVATLTIGNAAGVTLTNATTSISGALNLTNGSLTVPAAKTLTVNSGATATTGAYTINGAGSFALSNGAMFKTGNAAGISALGTATGAVQTTTARSFGAGASYAYIGPAAQITGTGLPGTVAGLTINNAAGATLTNDLTTTGVLTMTSGVLTTGTRTITLGATGTLSEQEASYVLGTVAANRSLAPGSAEVFGGLGLTLAPASGSTAPGATLVTRITGTALSGQGTSQSILRYFDIQPTVNTGLDVTMTFAYFDHELNGIPTANLALFKSVSGGTPWIPQRGTTAGPNVVTKTGIADFSVWTLGNSANPLPVELSAFTAAPEGNTAVRLFWTTASEKNSNRFEVERSTDGHTFAAIETVAAAGSSSSPRAYKLVDAKLPVGVTLVYYRLRQVDQDGTFAYSPVRTVALSYTDVKLALFPNPSDTGTATLTGAVPGTLVEVFDALGRRVVSTGADASGAAVLTLPKGVASGLYIVHNGPQTLRLMVE